MNRKLNTKYIKSVLTNILIRDFTDISCMIVTNTKQTRNKQNKTKRKILCNINIHNCVT